MNEETPEQKKRRIQQAEIIEKLTALGPDRVRSLNASGGLPSQWNATIGEWLKDK